MDDLDSEPVGSILHGPAQIAWVGRVAAARVARIRVAVGCRVRGMTRYQAPLGQRPDVEATVVANRQTPRAREAFAVEGAKGVVGGERAGDRRRSGRTFILHRADRLIIQDRGDVTPEAAGPERRKSRPIDDRYARAGIDVFERDDQVADKGMRDIDRNVQIDDGVSLGDDDVVRHALGRVVRNRQRRIAADLLCLRRRGRQCDRADDRGCQSQVVQQSAGSPRRISAPNVSPSGNPHDSFLLHMYETRSV